MAQTPSSSVGRNNIDEHNDDPKPFVWRKTVEEILAKVRRARTVLDNAATE